MLSSAITENCLKPDLTIDDFLHCYLPTVLKTKNMTFSLWQIQDMHFMSSGNPSPAKNWSNINSMKIYDTITEFVVIVKFVFFAVQSVLFVT